MTGNVMEAVDLAGTVSPQGFSVFSLIMQADIVVKAVVLLLLLASFWSWAVIFEKWRAFYQNKRRIAKFEHAYRSTRTLREFYAGVKKHIDNPMTAMFVAGMYEMTDGLLKGTKMSGHEAQQKAKERILYVTGRVKNRALERMEKDLIFLATAGGASPFIGLFGTVWGIVNSFQSIAATKNTTLAVVAPGIAEALLATGIGLVAAIPAVIFYNFFSNEIRRISIKLDDYANELSSVLVILSEQGDKQSSVYHKVAG